MVQGEPQTEGEARPTGTVTFLFTDIEDSSRLWERDRAAMGRALARHDQILHGAVRRHAGVVFATGGDGVAAVFARAGDAIETAVEAQDALDGEVWPAPVMLRVRMGLHTGEAEERGGNFFGPAVNRTARLMALACGGQVLVSLATAEVVRGQLGDSVALYDLGDQPLRSLDRPERIHELAWPGHAGARRLPVVAAAGNLPPTRQALVGRDQELADLAALLHRARLVTLVGAGGVGKTSLATAAAQQLAEKFADGVWLFELAGVHDDASVAPVIAETMGLRHQLESSSTDILVQVLAGQACLLVLDNCEHVLDAVATLAADVERRCPDVRMLATSREALGIAGEHLILVQPLDSDDSVQLFRERASEQGGLFAGAAADAVDEGTVAGLCGDLDGLPLAIELAAARARTMPLDDLVDRLAERFRLLRAARGRVERHRTLEATVAWSYDLLSADEKLLFDRLSVFAGGFDLRAAEEVAGGEGLDAFDVDDLVASLTDKSMISTDPRGRYVVLETLRQFGRDRLAQRDETDVVRQRHAAYFAELAVAAHDGLQGPNQARWLERLDADWTNIRSAFEWAVSNVDIVIAATIATQLMSASGWFDLNEPCLWIEIVSHLPGVDQHPLWPAILAGRSWTEWQRGDLRAALDVGMEALAAEQSSHPIVDDFACYMVAAAAHYLGEQALADESVALGVQRARMAGETTREAIFSTTIALCLMAEGRFHEALAAARAARTIAEASGNPHALSWSLAQEGVAMVAVREPFAEEVFRRGLEVARASHSALATVVHERELALILARRGQAAEAASLLLRGLQAMRRRGAWMFASGHGTRPVVQQHLIYVARVLVAAGAYEQTAQLIGVVRASSAMGSPTFQRLVGSLHPRLERELGVERLEQLIAEGAALPIERAMLLAEQALQELELSTSTPGAS